MITNPYKYVQLGVGSTKVKRRIVDTSTLSHILDFSQSNYRSWVLFDHDLQKHFKTMKSVKGYNGKSSSEYFPIDISEILTESSEQLLKDYQAMDEFLLLPRHS